MHGMVSEPTHVALIMDGNGRWAKAHGLPRHEGHRRGGAAVKKVLRAAEKLGIKYITLFAFSTENFSRPKTEVDFLMNLFERSLKKYRKIFIENEIRFRAIGDFSKLPEKLIKSINNLSKETKTFAKFNLTIAINYGARDEIVNAVKNILQNPSTAAENFDWETLKKHLYTCDLPDPDLIIRTSGEQRLSNFLLLQSAYSELYFTKTFWPDFGEKEFFDAIEDYKKRERKMGNIYDKTNF